MLEYSWYSVISPEGCAAILWRDAAKAPEAAEALKPTADDLFRLGIIDKIIPEPATGAHNDHQSTAAVVKAEILAALDELSALPVKELLDARLKKYRAMGQFK
jgi:acetyl-CoA carboxylase carboxyl transferase subunit alpha